MPILLIGSKGQLGGDITVLGQSCTDRLVSVDLPECDITDPDSLERTFGQSGPVDVVINAAAYTAVDKAEQDQEAAFAVNRDGPAILARACRQRGVPLIHVSTDYVFDGTSRRPYQPEDPISPISVYGRSKAEGEAAIQQTWEKHIILRTAWLFGLNGGNFVKTMLRLGKERQELNVVDDQLGCPTYAADLAAAILTIADHLKKGCRAWGSYHFCNTGTVTWYAFARRIFELARPYQKLLVRNLNPIPASLYPVPAPRPAYSVLDCTSLERAFGIQRRPWEEALAEMLAVLLA